MSHMSHGKVRKQIKPAYADATAENKKQKRKSKMKTKQETKTKQEQAEKPALTLTERQVEDFTRLAQLQKDGAANIKDRRLITDAYKAFAAENHDALSAEGGVRVGNLRVWIEVARAIHAEIVG